MARDLNPLTEDRERPRNEASRAAPAPPAGRQAEPVTGRDGLTEAGKPHLGTHYAIRFHPGSDGVCDEAEIDEGERYRNNRSLRLSYRRIAGKLSKSLRLKTCGMLPVGEEVTIVRGDVPGIGPMAGVIGAGRCRLVNVCPWCGADAREHRAAEIERYATRHLTAGGGLWFGAFTTAPLPGEGVEDSTDAIRKLWHEMWSGRWAAEFKNRWGIIGQTRSFEWTVRLDGTGHPHIHPLIWTNAPTDAHDAGRFYCELIVRWRALAAAAGRDVNSLHGVNMVPVVLDDQGRTVGLGNYVAKSAQWGIGHEMARVDVKRAKAGGTLSPWELLGFFAATGDLAARGAWQAYERAAHGIPAIYWAPHLRRKLDEFAAGITGETLDDDQDTDEQTVEAEAITEEAELQSRIPGARPWVTIDNATWRLITYHRREDTVLRIVEMATDEREADRLIRLLLARRAVPTWLSKPSQWPLDG